MKKAKAYCDGSGNSARNQAAAAIVYVGQEKFSRARLLPPHTTNNVGEYQGVLLALQLARELAVDSLTIHSDSELIVKQITRKYMCRDPKLRVLREKVWKSIEGFSHVRLQWIPREENKEADALCRRTIKASELIRP